MISDLQPKWTTVRGIGNSFPAKLSLAMPVIGYIILFNDVVVSIFKSNMHATSPMINGMFWNLYYYYFGLFSFGIASSIYYLFCSRLVRDYISFQSYYEAEAEDISPTEITEICNNLAKEKAPGFEKTLAIRALSESTGKKSIGSTRLVMYLHYQKENRRRKTAIIACYSLYAISILLLLIPSLVASYRIAFTIF